eukprot:Skav220774  [mRNA]  locus=scaffold3169:136340:137284:+ [translate_table: standard]
MMSDSLLGEHWTRASNVVVRRAKERENFNESPDFPQREEFSPRSVELADFQTLQLEVPRERRKSRRISSLREKSEQDLLQLRRASQLAAGGNSPALNGSKPMRKARKSKERIERIDPGTRSTKVNSMLRECLQIARFRLLETAREVSEKVSASLQNTRNPSVWPASMAPMLYAAPSGATIDSDGFIPSKRNCTTHALPLQWFQIKLVKMHAFNERLERKVKGSLKQNSFNDPEMLHIAFQEAMDEARRIQAQAVTAKNELRRLKRAVALARKGSTLSPSRTQRANGAPKGAQSPRKGPKAQGLGTLPTIVVSDA